MNESSCLIQNKYELLKKIGEGSYSVVYLGHHVVKDKYVAIKMDKNCNISSRLLKHEADVYLHFIKHNMKNVSSFKSYGIFGKSQYIIMEYLKMDLREYVEKNKHNMSIAKVNNLMLQCFRLLKMMHETDIVHRDIKPENFMFDQKMNLCIIDFGISCAYDRNKHLKDCVGTPYYSSYNTHQRSYIYEKKDDYISVYYVFFDLFGNELPWNKLNEYIQNEDSKRTLYYHMKRNYDYQKFYKGNQIVQHIIMSYNYYMNYDEFKIYS